LTPVECKHAARALGVSVEDFDYILLLAEGGC
jgi:hypothetical protein